MKRSSMLPCVLLLSLAHAACGDPGPDAGGATTATSPTNPAGPPGDADPIATTPPSSAPIQADGSTSIPNDDAGTPAPWPGSRAFFFSFPVQRQAASPSWGTALTDILRHMNPSFHSTLYDFPDDRIRWGVEITHGISSHLRFAYNVTGKPANGFYVMQDRATLVIEPAMKLGDVTPRVPMSLRGSRFALELGEQATSSSANDRPTSLLEDWIAATNGSEVGVDLVKQNLWGTTVRDGVATTFELTVYALAWAQAAMAVDPTYFQANPLTRELIAWNAERAMRLYDEGSQMLVFKSNAQEDFQAKFKAAPDAITLRNFARRFFGGPYVTKVLGIASAKE